MAQAALELVNGFRLWGKPLVIEFGRSKVQVAEAGSDPGPGLE